MSRLFRFVVGVALILGALALTVRLLFGNGERLDDLTGAPLLPGSSLETVVDLDYPPGNVAVSPDGRVFFTLHPDGKPPAKVLELIDGKPTPYPSAEFQNGDVQPHFQSI